jgi:inositol 1,4,5-triphosphate receptor type 2
VFQVDVMKEAYAQGLESEAEENSIGDQIKPKDVGHNIYILAHQVTP